MLGRICPPGQNRVKVSEKLGANAVAPVAPVLTSLSYDKTFDVVGVFGLAFHLLFKSCSTYYVCPQKLKFCLKTRQPGSTFYFFRHILGFFVWLSTLTDGIPYTLLELWTCIEAKGELKCHLMFSRYPMELTRTCSTVIKHFIFILSRFLKFETYLRYCAMDSHTALHCLILLCPINWGA